MLILVTNDDGIEAPGLRRLAGVAAELGDDVWVVAPIQEPLVQAHAFTLHEPLRVFQRRPQWIGVTGTSSDCVFLAAHGLLPRKPDLVLSGANRGPNVGDDIHRSGTVAAAMEASLAGVPAVAVSLAVDWQGSSAGAHWESIDAYVRILVKSIDETTGPEPAFLNLNVPDLPGDAIRGLRVCPLSRRRYQTSATLGHDPYGRPYYWLSALPDGFRDDGDCDGPLLQQGYATVTPLTPDATLRGSLGPLARTVALEAAAAAGA
jgi:5'-nucleotidase